VQYFEKQHFNELWDDSTLILDTSFVGLIKQSNPNQSKVMMDILSNRLNNIWIPNHVVQEYEQIKESDRFKTGPNGRMDAFYRRFSSLSGNEITDIKAVRNSLVKEMEREGHRELARIIMELPDENLFLNLLSEIEGGKEKVWAEFMELINTGAFDQFWSELVKKSGRPFTEDELRVIKADGNFRYHAVPPIPPGYKDKNKTEEKRYGDLIIWKQILAQIGTDDGSYIFVIADKKPDWFERDQNKIVVRPRRELDMEAKGKCPNADIHIVYFLDYLRFSTDHFFENMDVLIQHLEHDVLIRDDIIEYIENNLYELIEEDLQSIATDYKGCSWPDVVEDIEIFDPYWDNSGNICYEVKAGCTFEYVIDIEDRFDGPDDPKEEHCSGYASTNLTVKIPVEADEGRYNPNHLIVNKHDWEIIVDDVQINEITAPFEDEDQSPDEDQDDY